MNQFDLNYPQERDFDLNFCQERDFQANKTFLQKIRKGAPKMAGDREKKMAIDQKMGGDGQECLVNNQNRHHARVMSNIGIKTGLNSFRNFPYVTTFSLRSISVFYL